MGEEDRRGRKTKKKKADVVSDSESEKSDGIGKEKTDRDSDSGGRGTPRSASREIPGSPFTTADMRYCIQLHCTMHNTLHPSNIDGVALPNPTCYKTIHFSCLNGLGSSVSYACHI